MKIIIANGSVNKVIGMVFTLFLIGAIPAIGALPPGFSVHFNDAQHSDPNDLDTALVEFIGSATQTIEGAFYSIDRIVIVEAFINAIDTVGLENIRIITDFDNRNNNGCLRLIDAGITVIDETYDSEISESAAGNMHSHNKFCIVDGHKIWTGSYNITNSGTIYNNNHAVEIDCSTLAEAYLAEFNEMWGAESGPPGDCHFSEQKDTQYFHSHVCNGVPVEVYFSPTQEVYPNRAMDLIQALISEANSSVYFCLFAFTSSNIASKIIDAHDNPAVTVQGVMDDVQAGYSSSRYDNLIYEGVQVKLDNEVTPHGNLLHHKFAVLDHNDVDPVVITGSYNWSQAAQHTNDENSIFIYDPDIAERFYEEFYQCYHGHFPGPQDPEIKIKANEDVYSGGNFMRVWTEIENPGEQVSVDEYIILDLGAAFGDDRFYFWPSWSKTADYQRQYLSEGDDFEQEIFNFTLPYPLGEGGPFTMWAAFLDPTTGQLVGNYDFVQFSFQQ
jgi:phosphatidylserine/phosphatidylglycerophosphate/cardiolipin synthase-like enzyme